MFSLHPPSTFLIQTVKSLCSFVFLTFVGPVSNQVFVCAQEQAKKEITVKTPWGGFQAAVTADPSRLGLPVYPGAKFQKHEAEGLLDFNLSVPGKPDVRFVAGTFQTSDSKEKVRDFYQRELGKKLTKFTAKPEDGSIAFEMKHKTGGKYVELKTVDGVTEISLVRIEGLSGDPE